MSGRPLTLTRQCVTHLLLRLEALASSSIEGIVVDAARLLRTEVQGPKHTSKLIDHEAAAVLGNVRALERAVELAAGSAEMTVGILKAVHGELCKGTELEEWGGIVRSSQSWIGGILSTPITASYVPPAPQEVPTLLDDLCTFANRDDLSPVVQAALCHAQFEAIHPFADGNGRTGRALIQLCLIRRGVIGHTVLPISLALAHKREDYIDALNRYQHATDVQAEHDAINDWVSCFCGAVTTACTKVREIQQNLKLVRQGWRGQLDHVRAGSSLELMINATQGSPVFTIETMTQTTERSKQAVNLAVQRLLTTGIVRQANTGKRSRLRGARRPAGAR